MVGDVEKSDGTLNGGREQKRGALSFFQIIWNERESLKEEEKEGSGRSEIDSEGAFSY